jgi:chromosome segregation ATPase
MVRKDMPPMSIPSAKEDAQPATRKMLYIVRDELKSEIRSNGSKTDSLDAKINSLDSKVDSLDLKIDSLDLKMNSLDAKIDHLDAKLDARFSEVKADFHYIKLMLENDQANRKIVLEGHQLLWQRL